MPSYILNHPLPALSQKKTGIASALTFKMYFVKVAFDFNLLELALGPNTPQCLASLGAGFDGAFSAFMQLTPTSPNPKKIVLL